MRSYCDVADKMNDMNEPKNKKALETGSGISWSEWLEFLEPYRELNHTEMAKVALQKINERGSSKSPEWWAQGVTVAYEQHIGRRQVGQQCDGQFSVTVTKTIPGDMDAALATWSEAMNDVRDIDGVDVVGEPRITQSDKWRYWKIDLADGSRINVNIQTKPSGDKSSLAINHDKLLSADDVERWRAYWKSVRL